MPVLLLRASSRRECSLLLAVTREGGLWSPGPAPAYFVTTAGLANLSPWSYELRLPWGDG